MTILELLLIISTIIFIAKVHSVVYYVNHYKELYEIKSTERIISERIVLAFQVIFALFIFYFIWFLIDTSKEGIEKHIKKTYLNKEDEH